MNYWFTSDLHLGHKNIIEYTGRPFKSLDHMNKSLIRNWNSRVKPEDTVFNLGDFCFKNSSERGEGIPTPASYWESRLNGKIIHVRGNHDNNNSTKTIIQGILIKYHNHDVYLVHKPEHFNKNYPINFVGHVHNHWKVRMQDGVTLINVGVDVNKYMPISFVEAMRNQHIKGI